jgi:NAD(P)H dehydrogenase (quinone)
MIAAEDISGEAARLLVEGWSGRKIVELGSPVSPDDVDRAIREALGGSVQAKAIPSK